MSCAPPATRRRRSSRSSNKPLQASPWSGRAFPRGRLLALACASHSGERYHLEAASRLLAGVGLDVSALQNTPCLPARRGRARRVVEPARSPSSLAQNCSGKHAAMLATCVVSGLADRAYLDPEHPLQRAITDTVVGAGGEPVVAVAVDGCGAPPHAYALAGLARAFGRLAAAPPGSAEARVADAIRADPE